MSSTGIRVDIASKNARIYTQSSLSANDIPSDDETGEFHLKSSNSKGLKIIFKRKNDDLSNLIQEICENKVKICQGFPLTKTCSSAKFFPSLEFLSFLPAES